MKREPLSRSRLDMLRSTALANPLARTSEIIIELLDEIDRSYQQNTKLQEQLKKAREHPEPNLPHPPKSKKQKASWSTDRRSPQTDPMPSQIVMMEKQGKSYPHFRCQHCGDLIGHASEASVCWDPERPDQTTVICKSYKCEKAQERQQGGRYWMDLEVIWVFLGNNHGIDPDEARHKAEAMASEE
jgi:hypothetical protein